MKNLFSRFVNRSRPGPDRIRLAGGSDFAGLRGGDHQRRHQGVGPVQQGYDRDSLVRRLEPQKGLSPTMAEVCGGHSDSLLSSVVLRG